jgi:hypothetical protein
MTTVIRYDISEYIVSEFNGAVTVDIAPMADLIKRNIQRLGGGKVSKLSIDNIQDGFSEVEFRLIISLETASPARQKNVVNISDYMK